MEFVVTNLGKRRTATSKGSINTLEKIIGCVLYWGTPI